MICDLRERNVYFERRRHFGEHKSRAIKQAVDDLSAVTVQVCTDAVEAQVSEAY